MTLQQLRCLCQVVDQGLNLSRAARVLNTSQPAATRMIRALETELGMEILVRAGPRLVGVTEPGQQLVAHARQVLHEVQNLKLAASDSQGEGVGVLRVASAHLHARYVLVDIIRNFSARYPGVDINLILGTQKEIAQWTSAGEVDIGLCTPPEGTPSNLFMLDAYPISSCVIAPVGHPLLAKKRPSLRDIGGYPLITYDNRFNGNRVEQAFLNAGIAPKISLKTSAVDIIKTYVSAGLGIAVVQTLAVGRQDRTIRGISVDHLFPPTMCRMMLRRDQYCRRFLYDFIAMIAAKWTPEEVEHSRRHSYRRPEAVAV